MSVLATQRGEQFQTQAWLVVEECCNCHTLFAMTTDLQQRLRNTPGARFYCPNGHEQYYTGGSEVDRLKKQLEIERGAAEFARKQRDAAERRASAARGRVTRLKNSVARGECPCCGKRFQDLTRHMAIAHPDFESAETPADQEGAET